MKLDSAGDPQHHWWNTTLSLLRSLSVEPCGGGARRPC